ncbi:capsule assembly Wzi family protein [Lunatimonas salinarum]|uniref:capsule assembly Wzi family protein n=1 Tax=Lunatimonas salinarum TaxID=1774590 RepID=UPI001ADFAFBF|nr:capsule assembly Wzi family protein [Lunatimonas salinarum]
MGVYLPIEWRGAGVLKTMLLGLFGVFAAFSGFGQSIPAGYPLLDDYLRRLQLNGEIDSVTSLMIRPLSPRNIAGISHSYELIDFGKSGSTTETSKRRRFLGDEGRVELLPFMNYSEWNSKFPYPQTGPMIPNRGFQTFSSVGVYGELGPLSIQLQPEVIWAQNKGYDPGFAKSRHTEFLERFGDTPYGRISPGQSNVMLNIGAFSAGLSTENLWWGPGQFNALTFSNNAFGFEHFTLRTRRPAKTFLGSFEGQIIAGYLKGAEFENLISSFARYRREKRYLNAMILTYQPKWVSGLSVGLARTFQHYESYRGTGLGEYFPIFTPFQKTVAGLDIDSDGRDQQATVFVRWVVPEAKTEVYFEFGRRDHEATWRGMWLNPEHARAYIIGFSKLFDLVEDSQIQVRFEMFQQQESINILARYDGFVGGANWGGHIRAANGFTHRGQMLATGLGPSSNMQTLEAAWVKRINRLGIRLDRLNRHQDIFVQRFNDYTDEQRWVDLALSPFGEWRFNDFLVGVKLNFVHSFNYQWGVEQTEGMIDPLGKDVFNFQGNVSFIYPF